jgi:membrane associated rhomboid family serine protease
LIAFVLVVGAFANAAEYVVHFSPRFCGMSGVVLGLYSYQWVRYKLERGATYGQPGGGVWLIGFYLFGLLGFLPIANIVHTGGLVGGAIWGAIAALASRRRRR